VSITIGRVGSDGIDLQDPDISYSGNQVTLSGQYTPDAGSATGVADTLWLREQLLGLAANEAEPVVPVVWSARPEFGDELDGFYRVVDAQASFPVGSVNADAPFLQWSVTLERSLDYRQPRAEIYGIWSTVPNDFSISLANVITAVPSAVFDWDPGIPPAIGQRTTPDGNVRYAVLTNVASGTYVGKFALWPPDWYDGACRAQYAVASGRWRNVIGRRSFTSLEIGDQSVRVDNGLARVTPWNGSLWVEWYDPPGWTTALGFTLWEHSASHQVMPTTAAVLRSSPEEITLRVGASQSGLPEWGPVTVDVTLRRGSRWVYGKLTSTRQGQWELRFPGTVASSTVTDGFGHTGAIRRTSNNADGNREMLASNRTFTSDLVNGRIYQATTTNTEFLFGIGLELNGSAATGDDTANSQKAEWFSGQSETQRVVAT